MYICFVFKANGTCVIEFQGGGKDRESWPVSGVHARVVVLSCVLYNVMLLAG